MDEELKKRYPYECKCGMRFKVESMIEGDECVVCLEAKLRKKASE